VLALGGINFPQRAGTTMGILGTAAGIGSTFISWLMSFVSQKASIEAGFFMSFLGAFIALILVGIYYKRLKNSEIKSI
jgi:sugar phosphate permease